MTHNIPLLRDVLTESRFQSGSFTTSYLPETYPDGFQGIQLNGQEKLELASMAAVFHVKVSFLPLDLLEYNAFFYLIL